MILLERLQLVVPNGVGPLQPRSFALSWRYGSDVRVPFQLVDSAGAPYPLVEGTALNLGMARSESDATPKIQFAPDVITDYDLAEGYFTIPRTVAPFLGYGDYSLTVGFRDDNVGFEDVVTDLSRATIRYRPDTFNLPTTLPPSGTPLAIGPQGPPGPVPALQTRVAVGSVLDGTLGKTPSAGGVVTASTASSPRDQPLVCTFIIASAGADGDVVDVVVRGCGQRVSVRLDDADDAVAGMPCYASTVTDGLFSAADSLGAPLSIFQSDGVAGTTAFILA